MVDPIKKSLKVHVRSGDAWVESTMIPGQVYRTTLLPATTISVEALFRDFEFASEEDENEPGS